MTEYLLLLGADQFLRERAYAGGKAKQSVIFKYGQQFKMQNISTMRILIFALMSIL